jgi:pantetheine-phosphate adenylyltransferase, bacterial
MAAKLCVYPGSFDPVTNGHLDIIKRAAALFDEVVVAVLKSETKPGLFSFEKRVQLLEKSLEGMGNVRVESFDGLLVHFMAHIGAKVIIRGVRSAEEFQSESERALVNKFLDKTVETVFLAATPELSFVSSSTAKAIASFGGDAAKMLPAPSFEALQSAFEFKRKQ